MDEAAGDPQADGYGRESDVEMPRIQRTRRVLPPHRMHLGRVLQERGCGVPTLPAAVPALLDVRDVAECWPVGVGALQLPADVLTAVLSYLPQNSLERCHAVCRQWMYAIERDAGLDVEMKTELLKNQCYDEVYNFDGLHLYGDDVDFCFTDPPVTIALYDDGWKLMHTGRPSRAVTPRRRCRRRCRPCRCCQSWCAALDAGGWAAPSDSDARLQHTMFARGFYEGYRSRCQDPGLVAASGPLVRVAAGAAGPAAAPRGPTRRGSHASASRRSRRAQPPLDDVPPPAPFLHLQPAAMALSRRRSDPPPPPLLDLPSGRRALPQPRHQRSTCGALLRPLQRAHSFSGDGAARRSRALALAPVEGTAPQLCRQPSDSALWRRRSAAAGRGGFPPAPSAAAAGDRDVGREAVQRQSRRHELHPLDLGPAPCMLPQSVGAAAAAAVEVGEALRSPLHSPARDCPRNPPSRFRTAAAAAASGSDTCSSASRSPGHRVHRN